MEFVRDLLLTIEAETKCSTKDLVVLLPEDAAKAELFEDFESGFQKLDYHIEMLVNQAHFLEGNSLSTYEGKIWGDLELTWQGHEFLDTVRDPEVWRRTKAGAKTVGNWTISFLAETAKMFGKQLVKEKLGLDL